MLLLFCVSAASFKSLLQQQQQKESSSLSLSLSLFHVSFNTVPRCFISAIFRSYSNSNLGSQNNINIPASKDALTARASRAEARRGDALFSFTFPE